MSAGFYIFASTAAAKCHSWRGKLFGRGTVRGGGQYVRGKCPRGYNITTVSLYLRKFGPKGAIQIRYYNNNNNNNNNNNDDDDDLVSRAFASASRSVSRNMD